MVSLLNPGLPPLTLHDVLDSAGRLVDRHLQEDRSYMDLVDLLNVPADCKIILKFHIIYKLIWPLFCIIIYCISDSKINILKNFWSNQNKCHPLIDLSS